MQSDEKEKAFDVKDRSNINILNNPVLHVPHARVFIGLICVIGNTA